MAEITVVLDRKELSVSMDSTTMRVNDHHGLIQRFPIKSIARVIVIGRPMVSCDVWRALAGQNIPALLLPARGNKIAAHMGPWPASTALIRLAQIHMISDEPRCMEICRSIIRKKIDGQTRVLREHAQRGPDISFSADQLQGLTCRIKEMKNRQSLMGLEGAAASLYFNAIARIINQKWGFKGRNRRPPRDPLNSLLSFCYTLATSEVRREIFITGLDPSFGFLHANQPYRESLTLDVLEPLRPVIDQFAIYLLREKFTRNDFVTNKQDGCRLTKAGRSLFFKEWIERKTMKHELTDNEFEQIIKTTVLWIYERIKNNDFFSTEAA